MICYVLGLAAVVVYAFLVWSYDHWTKRGVKGPKPLPLVGNFPGAFTQRRHLIDEINDIYKKFKHDEDFVGVFHMRQPRLVVLSPELVRRVYVNDFKNFHDNEGCLWWDMAKDKLMGSNPVMLRGEEWKERRQEVALGFTSNRIRAIFPSTNAICDRLVKFIREQSPSAGASGIDAKNLSLRFTCEAVSDCVLGLKAQSLTNSPTEILGMSTKLFRMRPSLVIYMILGSVIPSIRRHHRVKFFTQRVEDFFVGLLRSALRMRRENPIDRMDFVNYILQKNLSEGPAISHTMTFLLDGFETTASVIAHCLLQLAREPECQDKLRQEIQANLNEDNRIDFEKLHNMAYLDQCVHESMRLISPVLMSAKVCTEPCEWVNKNGRSVRVEVDDMVTVPVHCLHHDEQFFANPEKFIPERFDPENGGIKKYREEGVFFPFGDGPRMCMGMKFALTQIKAAIVEVVRHFEVKVNPKTRSDNRINPTAFIGELSGGVWLDFDERKLN